MAFRKPLQETNANKVPFSNAKLSGHSISCSSRSNDALKRFQLPLHHNDSFNGSAKKPPIQQSISRTSRLNRPRATNLNSKEVVSTMSKKKQQRQQKQQSQKNQEKQQNQQEHLEQKEMQDLENQQWEQQTPEPLDHLSPNDDHTPPPESPQQIDPSIECEQEDTTIFYTETLETDWTYISSKRRHHDCYDDDSSTTTETEHDLQPLAATSPATSMSPSSSPPPKRLHCLETDGPQSPPGTDIQQNLPPPMSSFNLSTILPTNTSASSPLNQDDHSGIHHQTRLDTDTQQNLQPLVTPFNLSTILPANSSTSSPSNQDDHSETYHQAQLDTENQSKHCLHPLRTTFQLYTRSSSLTAPPTDGYDSTFNTPSPPYIDHTKGSQQEVMNSRSTILSPSRINRWESLSQDLSLPSSSRIYQPLLLPPPPPPPLSPVYKLNDDCLTEILKWCATTETLWEVSLVCKHWRNVALQPYVWRTINYVWTDFVKHLETMSLSRRGRWTKSSNTDTNGPFTPSPLVHIRTITLNNIHNSLVRLRGTPTSSIFTNLGILHLSNMQFKDILDLIAWTKQLNELDCKNIMTVDSNDMVMITPFSVLQKLHTLKLHFTSMCELIAPTSLSSTINLTNSTTANHSINKRWRLSPKLRILKILNTYDIEEFLTSDNNHSMARSSISNGAVRMEEWVQSWNTMETTLMHKYQVLTTLGNLTHLSLAHCTGYTARIWRECVAPATTQLTHLSLCGWKGDGNREAPLAWKERLEMASMTNTSVDLHMEDVERALAEMLAGLHHLQSLTLLHFKCTTGVICGLDQLTETTGNILTWESLEATMNNNTCDDISINTFDIASTSSLIDLLNWYLVTAEIKICDGSSVPRKKQK